MKKERERNNKLQILKLYRPKPGELIPWKEKIKDYAKIEGDEKLFERVWNDMEKIANRFIWFCLTDS